MYLEQIPEPDLEFAKDRYICPRTGIASFDVFDSTLEIRRDKINIGAVGTDRGLEKLRKWLERCREPIAARADTLQFNLYQGFPGFQRDFGFKAEMVISSEGFKSIQTDEINNIVKNLPSHSTRVQHTLETYLRRIEFLARNRKAIDVIICVLPDDLYDTIACEREDEEPESEQLTEAEDAPPDIEYNFRRALKAESLRLEKPLQLVREHSLTDQAPQDPATRAWNFCTALYYKTNQTVPWKLVTDHNEPKVCFVGIGFFRSRDREVIHTSLAQVFDELGNNVILRGGQAYQDQTDRRPHLKKEQAESLLGRAIDDYVLANETPPARLVIHKTSLYTEGEREGFLNACRKRGIGRVDLVSILDTTDRAFRTGLYPPQRGTHITYDEKTHLLYTRGSVPFYRTYTGLYIPQPLEVRIDLSDSSPEKVCREILGLTKMNWNTTRFDCKYPITLLCAQKVGEIMKYLPPEYEPKPEIVSYGYYM
jgi:hypothetical protein